MEKQEKKEGAGRRQTGQWGEKPTASLLADYHVLQSRDSAQAASKVSPKFSDGVRTLIMGKLRNLSDPVCWGSGVLMVLPFLVLQLCKSVHSSLRREEPGQEIRLSNSVFP